MTATLDVLRRHVSAQREAPRQDRFREFGRRLVTSGDARSYQAGLSYIEAAKALERGDEVFGLIALFNAERQRR